MGEKSCTVHHGVAGERTALIGDAALVHYCILRSKKEGVFVFVFGLGNPGYCDDISVPLSEADSGNLILFLKILSGGLLQAFSSSNQRVAALNTMLIHLREAAHGRVFMLSMYSACPLC